MAIKYSDMKLVETLPLDDYEKRLLESTEQYIVLQITQQYDKTPTGEISIDMDYFEFNLTPQHDKPITLTELGMSRRRLLREELVKRYEEAGWVVKFVKDTADFNPHHKVKLKGRD